MNEIENSSKRIIINTTILYLKMLINILVSILTVRLLLNALGTEEFGIYTLVSGLIIMFSFLNSAMTVSTQRFLSFSQGLGSNKNLIEVFCNAFYLHLFAALVISLGLFLSTDYIFEELLNVAHDKIEISKILYLYMVLGSFFSILLVPFRACLISHENIFIDSVFTLISSLLKLVSTLVVLKLILADKLIYLGALLALINVVEFFIYLIYCRFNYIEIKFSPRYFNKLMSLDMAKFAFWSLYTNICYVLNTQGFNVVFNIFYGTTINAAYGVAYQINNQLKELSMSLLRAITPQIMKSEGSSNRSSTINLSIYSTKAGFYLVSVVAIPSVFSMEQILNIWLENTPDYSTVFCVIFLVATMINQLTVGVTPAIQAVGKIKTFQICIGTVALTTLPIAYYLLEQGYGVGIAFSSVIIVEVLTSFIKVYYFSNICGYEYSTYYKQIICRLLAPVILNVIILYMVSYKYDGTAVLIFNFLFSFVFYTYFYYLFSLNKNEKSWILNLIVNLKRKYSR